MPTNHAEMTNHYADKPLKNFTVHSPTAHPIPAFFFIWKEYPVLIYRPAN